MISVSAPLTRLILAIALGAVGLGLIGWSYVRLERSPAADRAGAPPRDTQAVAARDLQLARARALLGSGDNAGAVAALDRALAAVPGDAEALALQVRALRAQRHYTAARAVARRILDRFPQSPLAHILLGSTAMREGDVATARRDLRRAVDLDTSSALALAQLAALDLMEGKVSDSRERALKALALDPDNTTALQVLSRVSRSVPELIAVFRRLLATSPGDQLTRSWLEVLKASAAPEVNYISPVETEVMVPCETGDDGRLYVRARVGPVGGLRLLVDTGASGLTLSESLARRMGMRLREFTESAGVGGLTRHSHPILVDRLDMSGMRARTLMATASDLPEGTDGIVNPIIFAPPDSGVIMEIRPAQRLLVFARGRDARDAGLKDGARWVSVPFLTESNHIIFRIVIAGRPAAALLDTGASADLIDRSLLERLPGALVQPVDGVGDSLIGFGGRIEHAETVEEATLRIAGVDFLAQKLFVVDLNDETFRFQVDLDAIVGMRRLSAFDLRIDPGAAQLSFRPID